MEETGIKNPILTVNIALSGKLSDPLVNLKNARDKLSRVINTTLHHLKEVNKEASGFQEEEHVIRFISSPEYIDEALLDMLHKICPKAVYSFTSVEDTSLGKFENVSILSGEEAEEKSLIFSWICNQTDFAVILTHNHISDRFLHYCSQNSIPCAVIPTYADSHILWTEKSLYDSFDDDKLINYLNLLLPDKETSLSCSKINSKYFEKKLFFGGLYNRYMKKYKAPVISQPFTKDNLMDKSSENNLPDHMKSTHQTLLDWFYEYNTVALKYAEKYRSSIYLRAVIPLILTVFIAIGFYIEPLFGPLKINFPGTQLSLWSAIAGLCFFIHAILNLYVYRLSENETAKSWHKGFIDNRFIDEALRIAVHFMSFGIPVNYTANFSRYGSKIKKESGILRRLRSLIRSVDMPAVDFNQDITKQCLESLEELVNDQIEYHKFSAKRYVNIMKALKSFGKITFYIGFIFIIFRGFLQCFLSFARVTGEIQTLSKSMANMLALLFPAWAGYFTSKLSLCNFEGLYNNDISMLEGLKELKQIINDKKNNENITYCDLYELSQKFSSLMLYEVSEWYAQINTRSITRL